jgi:hypothetical protein
VGNNFFGGTEPAGIVGFKTVYELWYVGNNSNTIYGTFPYTFLRQTKQTQTWQDHSESFLIPHSYLSISTLPCFNYEMATFNQYVLSRII